MIVRGLSVCASRINITSVADFQDPDFLVTEGEDDPPVAHAERPQASGSVSQRFGRRLRMLCELALDRDPDSLLGRRIESGNVA